MDFPSIYSEQRLKKKSKKLKKFSVKREGVFSIREGKKEFAFANLFFVKAHSSGFNFFLSVLFVVIVVIGIVSCCKS